MIYTHPEERKIIWDCHVINENWVNYISLEESLYFVRLIQPAAEHLLMKWYRTKTSYGSLDNIKSVIVGQFLLAVGMFIKSPMRQMNPIRIRSDSCSTLGLTNWRRRWRRKEIPLHNQLRFEYWLHLEAECLVNDKARVAIKRTFINFNSNWLLLTKRRNGEKKSLTIHGLSGEWKSSSR